MVSPYEMKKMDPEKLAMMLTEECSTKLPSMIDSIDDMVTAQRQLGEITNMYSYMMSCLTLFKIWTKELKKVDKDEGDRMAMRRDVIDDMTKVVNSRYNGLSRMLSVKQEINKELGMTGGI